MVLHYENVRSDPKAEMRKVLEFLKIPIQEERLDCVDRWVAPKRFEILKS